MKFRASDNRYAEMKYRRTGKSGLLLPEISLGLWHNFGADHSFTGQRKILRRAFDLGITHFDLANNYGPPYGAAEENFGDLFYKDFRSYRDEVIISTKAGYDMWDGPYGNWGSRKYLLSSLDQSLDRMELDYVDIFYSHRFDPDTPLEETMGALASAVSSGKALYVGISNYDSQQTEQAKKILDSMGVSLLIHQPKYSMFERAPENGLFDTLGRLGVGSIVFSPLAQGLLTDRYLDGKIPKRSRASKSKHLSEEKVSEQYLTVAKRLNEIAAGRGQSLAQLAISWVLRQPVVTSALIGASSVRQLEQNHAAIDGKPLSVSELSEIDALIRPGLVQG
jgi:L-glyceraldehyde 3-phosphate reductase